MGYEGVVSEIDRVVRALLSSIATFETLMELHPDERIVGNTLEEIGYHLGEMNVDEKNDFTAAVSRIAAAEDEDEPGAGDWVRNVPRVFGLT